MRSHEYIYKRGGELKHVIYNIRVLIVSTGWIDCILYSSEEVSMDMAVDYKLWVLFLV